MFCHQCGTQLEDGLAFCTNCGAKLGQEQKAEPVKVTPVQNYEQPVNPYTNVQEQVNYTQSNNQYYAVNNEKKLASPMKASFMEAIKLYFINYTNFTGRSTASEYWWAFLFNCIASTILSFIPYVGRLALLGLMLPGISSSVRRLHDVGKSWTYLLMGLIPIAGAVLLIIQFCKGSDGDNNWGPASKN